MLINRVSPSHLRFPLLSYNGKEFIAKAVVALFMENNPNIFTPRDQGSVENANKLVQRVLKGISIDRKRKDETVNRTNLLGQVMSVVNSQTGIRSYSASSYPGRVWSALLSNSPMFCGRLA
jgi:hypothetical protein